jgi:NAD(P)-dependent dehydrogenase (short-subunit alcohol dehydrogenase family)
MTIDLRSLLLQDLRLRPGRFEGKVIVVTGAGRGIGEQAARAFALLGAKVIIAELSADGQAVAQAIQATGGQALFVQTDVSDAASVAELARITHEQFGPADILVNNAIRCPFAPMSELSVELWDQVIAVNLRGTFLVTKAFLSDMLTRKSGTIINMVSTDAMPGLAAYIASKQGILGFSQTLALEAGPQGVFVIPFGPGMVDTPGIRGVADRLAPQLGLTREQFLNMSLHSAYDGLMPPEHAGAATAYLASELAEEFHGQSVTGYEVLERAGLLKTSLPAAEGSHPAPAAGDIAGLAEKLAGILAETEAEFGKLPAFIRPMAKNGFKNKAGMSLADWQRTAAALRTAAPQPGLAAQLEKLIAYFRDVPKETARFTKDEEFLREVQQTSQERIAVIESLIKLI